ISARRHLEKENIVLKSSIVSSHRLVDMIGKTTVMQQIFQKIIQFAMIDQPIIICGETGTGKELAAKCIHRLSDRADKPFVSINCATVPETLLENIFFGHVKGAFTNAVKKSKGLFEKAHEGFLFLDEVTELNQNMQAKLLRVLETGEFCPLGGKNQTTDVRIISATNKPFQKLLPDKGMRKDFFHRLAVIPLELPPLRERKDDIPLLVEEFLSKNRSHNIKYQSIPDPIFQQLIQYNWPGNIRELFNELNRFCYTGELLHIKYPDIHDTPDYPFLSDNLPLGEAVALFEKYCVERAIKSANGVKTKAAKILKIDTRTIYNKLKNRLKRE
ncbi:two component, sigma54 specific, Fis family transcriptional regulator, partial [Candidatus Magnetomorum sp. HK-1]